MPPMRPHRRNAGHGVLGSGGRQNEEDGRRAPQGRAEGARERRCVGGLHRLPIQDESEGYGGVALSVTDRTHPRNWLDPNGLRAENGLNLGVGCNGNCPTSWRAQSSVSDSPRRWAGTDRRTPTPLAECREGPFRLLFEPAPAASAPHEGLPSGQNARLRAGIEKEIEGVTLVSTRHSPSQFPLHPCSDQRRFHPWPRPRPHTILFGWRPAISLSPRLRRWPAISGRMSRRPRLFRRSCASAAPTCARLS